jgi:vitamin B12/bleomycin/antimicrobial peptide transport system ATP-binding/permease protein
VPDNDVSPIPASGEPNSAESAGLLHRFMRLAVPYFSSDEKWMARLLAAGIILLTLLQLAIQIRLNIWNKDFFNALGARDWNAFLGVMGLFAFLAAASMGVAVYQVYLKQLLQLRWRRWLTAKLVAAWLENGRHYQLNFIGAGVDNPDQRIAENVRGATEMAVEFALGIFNAVVTLISFTSILWLLSGTLQVAFRGISFGIPGYMVWAALIYAGFGTFITYIVGRPIVAANVGQNAAEADYRYALVRLRENSEGVALIRGEDDEQKGLTGFFASVFAATIRLMRTQRRLMWLTSGYGMIGMVYPTLVASPRYFSGVITLGGLMQITAAFGQVQTGLTWFVDNFPRIAEWRSNVERLLEFELALGTTAEATSETGESTVISLVEASLELGEEALSFRDLQIAHADGSIVIGETNTKIAKGERVLIVGDSGSGKSTLFRAIAGLWPWGAGSIFHPPRDDMMFMPQRSYLPLGTLRAALAYPAPLKSFAKSAVKAALERCGLGYLIERLDEIERWDRVLSVGEQQRVAFARLLLHKPGWVFMDEATSALDEEIQKSMMNLFRDELAGSTLISIAHRPGLDAFHDRTLSLIKSATGAHLVTKRRHPASESPSRRRILPKKLLPKKLLASFAGHSTRR